MFWLKWIIVLSDYSGQSSKFMWEFSETFQLPTFVEFEAAPPPLQVKYR